MFRFDNPDKPYVKHQLRQTDEINTDEHKDIEEVAVPAGAVQNFVAIRWDNEWFPSVAIRWDNEWFPSKSKNLHFYQFP